MTIRNKTKENTELVIKSIVEQVHHCIDLLKKRNKSIKFWTSFKQEQATFFAHREKYQYDDIIHELLDKLTMDERRILLLRSIEEYSFDEITSIMEIKPTTVRKKYYSIFTLSPIARHIGVDIFDDKDNKIKLITGNGWSATDGSNQIMDLRYNPFESVPKTITLKPYLQLYDDKEIGAYQYDENGEPKIQYISELEVKLDLNSYK